MHSVFYALDFKKKACLGILDGTALTIATASFFEAREKDIVESVLKRPNTLKGTNKSFLTL